MFMRIILLEVLATYGIYHKSNNNSILINSAAFASARLSFLFRSLKKVVEGRGIESLI